MLTRAQFVKALNFIIQQSRKENEFESALQKYTGDTDFTGWHTSLCQEMVVWLEDAMGDKSGTVSWWLWDGPDAGLNPDEASYTITYPAKKKSWILRTPEDVYDYLVEDLHLTYGTLLEQKAQLEAVKLALHEIDRLSINNEQCNKSNEKFHEYNALFRLIRSSIENQYRLESGDTDSSLKPSDCQMYVVFRKDESDDF